MLRQRTLFRMTHYSVAVIQVADVAACRIQNLHAIEHKANSHRRQQRWPGITGLAEVRQSTIASPTRCTTSTGHTYMRRWAAPSQLCSISLTKHVLTCQKAARKEPTDSCCCTRSAAVAHAAVAACLKALWWQVPVCTSSLAGKLHAHGLAIFYHLKCTPSPAATF